MSASNPVADECPLTAIDHCRAVLSYLANATPGATDETLDFGHHLILQTVIEALAQAQQGLQSPTGAA